MWSVSSGDAFQAIKKSSSIEENESENYSNESDDDDNDYPSSIAFDFELHKNYNLFNDRDCGIAGSYRILNGDESEILSHSWQVALKAVKGNTTAISCGGSLISGKYKFL
jgi:hypothetical protein